MDVPPSSQRFRSAAVAIWVFFAIAIAAYVVLDGERTVTPTYRIAANSWFAGRGLYNGPGDIGGFLYFPQSALVYGAFVWLPHDLGETLWRICGLALLASGIARVAQLIRPEQGARMFLFFTLLCLPATVSSARNGQMNLHLAALMLHATVDLALGVWWRAALSLTLGIVLKPFAVVPALLAVAVYPRTRYWLAVMLAAAVAIPFLLQDPAYVARQYGSCLRRLAFASEPATDTWSDLRGLLLRLELQVPDGVLVALRAGAALGTLGLAFSARRQGTVWSAVYLFALAATYLMIFNPRTESNSYVMLAPAVAALTLVSGRTFAVAALVIFAVILGCENYGRTVFAMTDLWLKPLLTIGFAAYLVACVLSVGDGRRLAAGA